MENIYKPKEPINLNFIQRLFNFVPKENAFIEVNNLLATKPLKEIKLEDIEEISARYKVNLHDKFLDQLKYLYKCYLEKCFEDNVLTDAEFLELTHLKHLLILQDYEVEQIHEQLGGKIYKKSYGEAIKHGILEKQKEDFLDKLRLNLRLPEKLAEKISAESRNHFMNLQLEKITEDGRISPDEWDELNMIAKNLDVQIKIDEGSKAQLEKMKLYWLIENGELPTRHVDINLQKNEVCYYSTYTDWLENRTVTQRYNYGGVGYRIKIMKGVYYKAGSVKVKRITSEQLLQIDNGSLYITNRRIIFIGAKKNTSIQLSKILSITPYSDGIGVEKDSGKSPILRVLSDADLLAMTLARVINDLQNN